MFVYIHTKVKYLCTYVQSKVLCMFTQSKVSSITSMYLKIINASRNYAYLAVCVYIHC